MPRTAGPLRGGPPGPAVAYARRGGRRAQEPQCDRLVALVRGQVQRRATLEVRVDGGERTLSLLYML